jgi:hypothetical protein
MGPSSAGAIGWMQFMPDTWLRWGADYSGDGVADPWNAKDAVFSAARYLAAAGGANDVSRGVFSYNHAQWYVDEVLSLARLLSNDSSLSFSLDELQVNLEKAERQVASLNQKIAQTRARAGAMGRRAQRMFVAAEKMELIDARSAARERAAGVQIKADSIEARVAGLNAALETAEKSLTSARAASVPQSFSSGTSVYLASAQYENGYVFPVGGGPSRVSVGRYCGPGRLAGLRAGGRRRRQGLANHRSSLRHRPQVPHGRWSPLGLLSPLLHRALGRDRHAANGRLADRPRRLDRARDRAAPPSRAASLERRLSPGSALVPELRQHRFPLAGRGHAAGLGRFHGAELADDVRRRERCGRRFGNEQLDGLLADTVTVAERVEPEPEPEQCRKLALRGGARRLHVVEVLGEHRIGLARAGFGAFVQ